MTGGASASLVLPSHGPHAEVVQTLSASGPEEFADAVGRSFFPLAVVGVAERFSATIRQVPLGRGVRVAGVVTATNAVSRTRRLARQAPSDEVLLLVQLTGTALARHEDRAVTLDAGSATLADPLVEYSVTASASNQLVLMLPRTVVQQLAAPVSTARLRRIDGRIPSLRALIALTEETLSTQTDMHFGERDALAGAVTDLARSVFARLTDSVSAPSTRDALVRTALHVIRDHATEPGLTAEAVAHAVGVSPRQLTTLLRPEGSPSRLIRSERLRRARAMLMDPLYEKVSVGDIARRSGFTDPTTFTRAFRREFHDLPSDLRRTYLD